MQAQDSPMNLKLRAFLSRSPLVKRLMPYQTWAQRQRLQAAYGFCALGTHANSALPALTDLYLKRGHEAIAFSLVNMSEEGRMAASQCLTNRGVLLTNKAPCVRQWIVEALAQLGALGRKTDASATRQALAEKAHVIAAPSLRECLSDRDSFVCASAAHALLQLGSDQEAPAAALPQSLSDPNPPVRENVKLYLVMLGLRGPLALPVLEKALQNPDPTIRGWAANLIQEQRPEPVRSRDVTHAPPTP